MTPLILHSTQTAQWYALVQEAECQSSIHLGETLQSYLVFLLMRFLTRADLAESVLALEFLKAEEGVGYQRASQFRELGDKCLLFSGLFPGHAERAHVRVSYFVNLGQSAYGSLSTSKNTANPDLFNDLSAAFVPLMDVLQTLSRCYDSQALSPLTTLELWQDTHSKAAGDLMRQQFPGMICFDTEGRRMH